MTDFTAHFDDDAWHSFVRGIPQASHEQAMRAHLDLGCAECQRAHETWRRFVEVSDATTDSEDRFAKAVLALRRRIPFRPGLALLAERVFDSFQDPSPVGIRGSASAPRQLVYEAGGYVIDLQREQKTDGPGTLMGQVAHAWAEGATRGAGIVLVREDSLVGQTVANSIGEFQFDCECWDNLKICLGIADETSIEVKLPEAGSGPLAAGSAPLAAGSAKEAADRVLDIGGRASEDRGRENEDGEKTRNALLAELDPTGSGLMGCSSSKRSRGWE